MLVRLAATIDTIDPPCKTGRPRDWSTVTMLGALWHLARDGCVWRRLPVGPCLPAAPERVEPVPALAAARGARPGARPPGGPRPSLRAPPPRRGGGGGRPPAATTTPRGARPARRRGPRGYDAHKKVK